MDNKLIVVFGGTFDPVHLGHIYAARSVLQAVDCEKVIFMPAACPPHKSGVISPAADRLNMLKLAIEGEPRMEISTLELLMDGPSYTYRTVEKLRQQNPGYRIAWVVGMDMYRDLPNWRNSRSLLQQIRVIAVARPPMPDDIEQVISELADFFGPDTAQKLRRDILLVEPVDISSTFVRNAAAAGRSLAGLVPEKVEKYITSHGLYSGQK